MKVAIAGVRPAELSPLQRAVEAVPATLSWIATGAASLADRCRTDPPDVLVASAHGTFDALASLGGSTTDRRFAIVVVVDDRDKRVHEVYAAMERGAADVARMPTLRADGTLDDPDRLVAKLGRLAGRSSTRPAPASDAPVVLLAASTGGPQALARVLADMGSSPARILLAQHIDETFSAGLADWLSARSGRRVEMATENAALDPTTALLVRTDAQPLVDARGRIRYRPFAAAELFHPCVDALFESCLRLPTPGVAVLLTGMGEDGARGLLALRSAGWTTIAQDAATSVVFGMPAKAAALGAASRVLPLDDIGPVLSRTLTRLASDVR